MIKMAPLRFTTVFLLLSLSAIVRASEFHIYCQTNQDCADLVNEFYVCKEHICKNKKMLEFDWGTIFGLALIILVSAIANAGGVGGGAILSAVYILWFKFSIGDAIPLSNATIFSGALMNFFVIFNKRHDKNKNRLLIDYKITSLILPLMLGGALIGVVANKVLPPVFVVAFLTYYLITKTISFYKDAKDITEKENLEKELAKFKRSNAGTRNSRKLVENKLIELASFTPRNSFEAHTKDRRLNQSTPDELLLSARESKKMGLLDLLVPYKRYIWLCLASYGVILTTMLLRGGKAFPSIIGIESCSFLSWLIFFIAQGVLVGLGLFSFKCQEREAIDPNLSLTDNLSLDHSQGQVHIRRFMIDSFNTGILSGTLGLGGGIILMSVLISRNILPAVASGICGVLVLITSFSTTSQFLIMGAFDIESTLIVVACSGIGSYFGSQLINYAIQKYEKPSLIMWVVFAILLLSAVLLPYVGLLNIIQNPNFLNFSSPC